MGNHQIATSNFGSNPETQLHPNLTARLAAGRTGGTVGNRRNTDFKLLADLIESIVYDLFPGDQISYKSFCVLLFLSPSLVAVFRVLQLPLLVFTQIVSIMQCLVATQLLQGSTETVPTTAELSLLPPPGALLCYKVHNLIKYSAHCC